MCAVLLVLQIQLELGGAGPDPQGAHTTHCDSLLAGKSFPTILQPPPASHGGWGWWWSLHTPLPAVHCVFLFYPVRLADQPLHCPRARAVYLLGEGGHVLSAQRDSNVQNSAQSQSLHFRWCHFLHGVENSSIFLPPLNYQHLYKGTFLGNPL